MKRISFKWDSSLESGIPLLDLQHKTFLAHLLKFSEDCESNLDEKTLIANLSFLKSYGMEHLALEEGLMDIIGYRRATSHKAIHTEFKARVEALIANFENYSSPSNTILSSNYLMTDWFLKHIKSEDAALCHALIEAMDTDPVMKRRIDAHMAKFDTQTGRLSAR